LRSLGHPSTPLTPTESREKNEQQEHVRSHPRAPGSRNREAPASQTASRNDQNAEAPRGSPDTRLREGTVFTQRARGPRTRVYSTRGSGDPEPTAHCARSLLHRRRSGTLNHTAAHGRTESRSSTTATEAGAVRKAGPAGRGTRADLLSEFAGLRLGRRRRAPGGPLSRNALLRADRRRRGAAHDGAGCAAGDLQVLEPILGQPCSAVDAALDPVRAPN
jgi:hypothetical protein